METMKNKFFLRNRRESQPHSSSKTKTNAVRRTLDSSGLGNESAPTPFPSPDTIHAPDSCSFADEPQTHKDAGGLVWSFSPQTVVEDPSPALTPDADASARRQSTAATFAFHRKSGKAKKLWRKVRGKFSVTTGLRDRREPASAPGDPESTSMAPTHSTIGSRSTSISVLASSDQTDSALSSAAEPFGWPPTAITYLDHSPSTPSPEVNTAVPLVSRIGARTRTVHDNTAAVITILRDLGEIAENIPFIKAVAGATLALLKIRDVGPHLPFQEST